MIRQNRIKTILTLAAIAMAPFAFTITPTQAALVIYEPFDYAEGLIDGSQTGGTGFSATGWTTSGSTQFHSVITPGLTFAGLPTQGNALRRNDREGNSETHRPISGGANAALTADNSTIWFSLLVDTEASYPKGNNLTFLFATDAIDDPSVKTPTITGGGEGLGISFLYKTPTSDQASLTALVVDDGTSSRSEGMIGPFTGNDLLFIAGKIDWAVNGSNDTLSVYNIVDPAAALPAPFATMTADLDQSQFDTLAISDKQRAIVDEIRFGTTFADVIGVSDPNFPSVDAGGDMISWSGQAVAMDPNIVETPGSDWTTLTYLWTAGPNGIDDPNLDVEITDANQEAASVTITKAAPTGDATVIAMTLAVNDEGRLDPPVRDSMTIDVYDDSCLAAKAAGLVVIDPTDIDGNCITNLADFAVMATTWLNDYTLTEPVAKFGEECTCSEDIDCGTDGFVGDYYCYNDNINQDYITFECLNPNTPEAVCTNTTQINIIETCSIGCAGGECVEEGDIVYIDGGYQEGPIILNQPNTYYRLSGDLTISGDGFIIEADGITLDLNGYTITGDWTEESYGIYSSGNSYITIKNGTINSFWTGLCVSGGTRNTLKDLTA